MQYGGGNSVSATQAAIYAGLRVNAALPNARVIPYAFASVGEYELQSDVGHSTIYLGTGAYDSGVNTFDQAYAGIGAGFQFAQRWNGRAVMSYDIHADVQRMRLDLDSGAGERSRPNNVFRLSAGLIWWVPKR